MTDRFLSVPVLFLEIISAVSLKLPKASPPRPYPGRICPGRSPVLPASFAGVLRAPCLLSKSRVCPRGPLPPPDLFFESRGGQGSGVLRVVGYVYVIGVWCGKWVLIDGGRKLRWGWSVLIFG